jgi:starch synthase (maltosyl-transferring)
MDVESGIRGSGLGMRADDALAPNSGARDERGRRRIIIERVWPEIDGGRFPIKRTVGEQVTVSADVFADGHDLLAGVVKYRHRGPEGSAPQGNHWQEVPLVARDNDRWDATFTVSELGEYEYTIEAWIDRFGSWLKDLIAKADADQDVSSELREGAEVIQAAVGFGARRTEEVHRLLETADLLRSGTPQVARSGRRRIHNCAP